MGQSLLLLFAHHAEPLADKPALLGLVHHGDGIVGITDAALPLVVEDQLLASQLPAHPAGEGRAVFPQGRQGDLPPAPDPCLCLEGR